MKNPFYYSFLILTASCVISCGEKKDNDSEETTVQQDSLNAQEQENSQPLVTDNYTADPSAHVFNGKIYIYPSHDWDSGIPEDDMGSHFNMKDYHVYSMDSVGGEVQDHGVVLDVEDVEWAKRQMWAPDAAEKDGTYYLYFPAKNEDDIFKIGVATADNPAGPFTPQPEPIENSFSIDPAVFADSDGEYYMYFGGIWGGQLQRWQSGNYVEEDKYPADSAAALQPKVAKMSDDMMGFAEAPRDIKILDKEGNELTTGDNERRFFEAAWVHKMNGKYYFSYSTGDTHKIVYATGDSPYGPFTYQGVVLEPVLGWTNHHSIVEYNGKWYLFYHDSSLSGGKTYLRSVKMTELQINEDGSIETVNAMVEAE
ncbi:glycoside hydrolase family 43 protein [Zunongwangia sp. F363]|uniref:Glycoside hydrolase family 43 protein n=1 Tax=Autumnicola tepida TaxID=3075595 RepID=A0ABU3CB62_9FLAO|nr:glycoside hydrolase family 43 protein [Zunongwangia sp. F363]MDT0643571.1 glycoside hydrolase family 43 protein [Zunongwangia sp. F363]